MDFRMVFIRMDGTSFLRAEAHGFDARGSVRFFFARAADCRQGEWRVPPNSCRRGTGHTFSRKSMQKAGDASLREIPKIARCGNGRARRVSWVMAEAPGWFGLRESLLTAPSDPFPNRAGNFPALLMSPSCPRRGCFSLAPRPLTLAPLCKGSCQPSG